MQFLNDNKHIGPKAASSHAGSSRLFGWSLKFNVSTATVQAHLQKAICCFFLWVGFLKIIWAICYLTRARRFMCSRDKYASLGKEKRRQQTGVSPLHWEKKQTSNKAMGSTTGFSAGVNQHTAALISWFLFTSAEDLANTQTPWNSALN